jgi:hypothetical protein
MLEEEESTVAISSGYQRDTSDDDAESKMLSRSWYYVITICWLTNHNAMSSLKAVYFVRKM